MPDSQSRSEHPQLATALARLAKADLDALCAEPPPPELVRGIAEFNEGKFFEQHETLEALWLRTPGEIRYLYQGILQIGVGMYHLVTRQNVHGATVKLESGVRFLEPFPRVCQGVDVGRLREDARRVREQLLALGPERLRELDPALIPHVHLVS